MNIPKHYFGVSGSHSRAVTLQRNLWVCLVRLAILPLASTLWAACISAESHICKNILIIAEVSETQSGRQRQGTKSDRICCEQVGFNLYSPASVGLTQSQSA